MSDIPAQSNTSLPNSWTYSSLEDISEIILGQSPPSSTYNEENIGLPFYQGKSEFGKIYPTPIKFCSIPKKTAEQGDVLISVRAPVGPTNICPAKSCIGRGLAAIRGLNGIEPHFILYLMRSYEHVIAGKGTGTTFKAITGKQLREFKVPVPPLNEQIRIVSKIEELFTKLDAGIQELTLAREKLKIYRQSVLKNAFEGKLTKKWSETHKADIKTSSILDKINLKAKKELGKKYKELSSLDLSDLPELPKEWIWVKLGYVADKVTDGTHQSPKLQFDEPSNDRFLYVTSKNIKSRGIDLKNITYVDKETHEGIYNRCNPELGDVLLIKDGVMTGRSTINDLKEKFSLLSSVALIKLNSDYLLPKFVNYYLSSPIGQRSILGSISGVAITRTNLKKINNTPIPFVAIKEQEIIVNEVEKIISKIQKNEEIIDQTFIQAQKLRRSILIKAFSGQLVPHDSKDEPAEKLLERINAEKEKQKPKIKTRKSKSKQERLI